MSRLQDTLVEVGTPVLFPNDNTADQSLTNYSDHNRHRFGFTGAGAATATVEYKLTAADAFRTLVPPTDWSELETWIASGLFQFRLTAVGSDFTADLDSFTE